MIILLAALFWYLAIGVVIALMYKFSNQQTRPTVKMLVILILIFGWLPAAACFFFESRETETKKPLQ